MIAVAVTWGYLRFVDKGQLKDLGLGWQSSSVIVLAIGWITSVVAVTIALMAGCWLGKMDFQGLASPSVWAVLAVLGIATQAGWVEELVCRGVVLQKVEAGANRSIAIIVSSMLFVFFHLFSSWAPSPVRLLQLALFGLTMAAAYYVASRRLWLPVGLHWGADLAVFSHLGLNIGRQGALINWRITGSWTIAGANLVDWLILASLPLIWLCLGVWWWHTRQTQAA